MQRLSRAGAAAAVAAVALLCAGSALAANTATIAVSFTPPTLGSSTTALIHVAVPQTTDPIAAINIYTGTKIVNVAAAPNTQIGSVTATAFAHDAGLNLPLSGPVMTDDPAKHTADACSPGTNQAVWNMNLTAAGQTLVLPIYVNQTTGAQTALGAYDLRICLPPWDVPVGTPGRAFDGAQLLDAQLSLSKILVAPTSAGVGSYETLFTPYTPGKGTPNPAGTFEARAIVPLPATITAKATYSKKTKKVTVTGKATLAGTALAAGTSLTLYRGTSAKSLKKAATVHVGSGGSWKLTAKLTGKKTTYFQAGGAQGERDDTAAGCQSPLPPTAAPGGCVSATLSAWSTRSAVVHVKP